MKTMILAVLILAGCSTEETKEFIDCAYDGNSEQYQKCILDAKE